MTLSELVQELQLMKVEDEQQIKKLSNEQVASINYRQGRLEVIGLVLPVLEKITKSVKDFRHLFDTWTMPEKE